MREPLVAATVEDRAAHDYGFSNRRARASDGRKLALLPGIWRRARAAQA